jgi:hypothetical protein
MSALHGPFPESYREEGIVGECLFWWAKYTPTSTLHRLRDPSSAFGIGRWFCVRTVPFQFPPSAVFRVEHQPVLEAHCYSVDPHTGILSPIYDGDGHILVAQSLPREAQLVSAVEFLSDPVLPSPLFLLLGFFLEEIPSPEENLLLFNRLHVAPRLRDTPLLTEIGARTVTHKKLTVLQSSADPRHSVFALWDPVSLRKLLKWLPKAPIGPQNKSYVIRFLHRKLFVMYPGSVCPHCGDIGGFTHEQFLCPLSRSVFLHFVRQFAAWSGYQREYLMQLQRRLLVPIPADMPHMLCWNVAIWLLRRAIYSSRVHARLNGSLLSPALVVLLWRHYLLEFVGVISKSETHAGKFALNDQWFRKPRNGPVEITLGFLPLP